MKKLILVLSLSLLMFQPVTAKAEVTQNEIAEIAESYSLCPELVEALIFHESRGIEDVVSKAGCIGLMQVNPKWHKDRMERLNVTDLKDGKSNVLVGCDYLAELFDTYEDVQMVLDAYNGNLRPESWYESHTSYYAKVILDKSAELEAEHNK